LLASFHCLTGLKPHNPIGVISEMFQITHGLMVHGDAFTKGVANNVLESQTLRHCTGRQEQEAEQENRQEILFHDDPIVIKE
jgi:hypothetical protein